MKEIKVGTAVSNGAGVTRGMLKTVDQPDGAPVEIPVIIVRGAGDGPTLWLHGCVHGNEYCGTYIIHECIRSLEPDSMSGAVVALPILNLDAFRHNQRMSPYEGYGGGDLNRCFPGDPAGSLTRQIAHAIYQPLREHADYLVDFHTAVTEDTMWSLYTNAEGETGRKAEGVARAYGHNSTLPAPMDILAGSAMMTAAKDGIPGYIIERGGKGPAFTRDAVVDGAERLRNVMRHVGILDGPVTDYGPLTYFSNFHWVTAQRGGLFQPAVKCGDRITEGQTIGHYFNVYGDPDGEAVAPSAGVVLAMHGGPLMANGETLIHIGLDPREV